MCHETIHIVQGFRGHLKDISATKKKWRGEIIDLEKVNYYDLPYEAEARLGEFVIGSKIIEKLL